jgi:O-antigen/teichoic acid export membrane protein
MRKTFVSNLILLVAVNLLVKPFYLLGIEAEIQNRTGPAIFGSYFALINFSFLLNVLPDMGVTNWNTRSIAGRPELLTQRLPVLLSLRGLLSIAYLIVIMCCGMAFGYSSSQLGVLALLAINQILASAILFMRSNLAGLHLFRQDSLFSVLDRALLVIAMAALLWIPEHHEFQIEWLVWGQTAAYACTLAVAFVFVLRHTQWMRIRFDRALVLGALRASFPYALLILISAISLRIDGVLLERLRSAESAGHYAMGFRFFDAVTMIAFLFASLLLPIFARMHSRREAIAPLLGTAFRLMAFGAWMVMLYGLAWSSEILHLIYDRPSEEATASFRFLMAGCAAFSMQYVFGTLLTAMGELRTLIRIAVVALGVNIAVNLLLIPSHGAVGSAVANVAAQGIALVLQIVAVHRQIRAGLTTDYTRAAAFVLVTAAMMAAFLFGPDTIKQLPFTYKAPVFLSLSLLVAIGTRVLDFRAFLNLLRQRE